MSDSQQEIISKEEYTRQFNELSRQSGGAGARLPLSPQEIQPMLEDRTPTFDFDGHYVYHVGWAAEVLGKTRPKEHVDIGSFHYFSLIVSGFIPTTFLDYRPMELKGLGNYATGAVDLKNLNISSGTISSLSCMHVLEHIGLGRYGDDLDYDGDLKAASELKRVLAPGGMLLIAVPIGRPRIKFNAHRIYSTKLVFDMFDGLELLDFSLIPDNCRSTGIIRQSSFELANQQEYGCGCFCFRKPGAPLGSGMVSGESEQLTQPNSSMSAAFKPLQASYSQCGEDRIMSHLAEWLNIKQPTYLDIGAHDPVYLNNTYLFYQKGCHGVLIEPDPALFEKIAQARPLDTCLNIGISSRSEEMADFFVMDVPTLNTFSREEAERYCSYGERKITKVIQIPLISVNDIMQTHFGAAPDILSLDVEGLDYEILTAIDFTRFRPRIICVETLTYTENNTEKKLSNIIEFMKSVGYLSYADTFINTIFVSREAWKQRGNGAAESSSLYSAPPIQAEEKKLTVCIPTYRRPEILKQCLASIDAQTLGKNAFRVMISDNAAEIDKTEILASFPDLDIQYFPQPVNLGMGGNFFFLISQVKTEFAMLIPDDERLKPRHLERVLQALLDDPRLVAAYSGYEFVDENSGRHLGGNVPILAKLDKIKGDITWSYKEILAMLALDTHVFLPCTVFRVSPFRDVYCHYKHQSFYSFEKIICSMLADYGLIRFINEHLLLSRVGHHNVSADIDDESKRADQRYTTEWVMKLGYSRGVDIQGFWRDRLFGPNQEMNREVASALLGAFGQNGLQSIASGNYWSDNERANFEPAFPGDLLAEILAAMPNNIQIFSQVFHAHQSMPKTLTFPLEQLSRDTVPSEFCLIDLAPENGLMQCQLENGLLPDQIEKVVVAMPFLGGEPWGERMYHSRSLRILLANGFTVQEHRVIEAKDRKTPEIVGLKPDKWGERAKNLVSTYHADGIIFVASRQRGSKATTKKDKTDSSTEMRTESKKTSVVVFSRDRAMQLEATLRSLTANCHDIADTTINIIYTTSTDIHFNNYEKLISDLSIYRNLKFIRETEFHENLCSAIAGSDYLFFVVDDNIFIKPFSLKVVLSSLQANPDAIGFSLRLGENTTYCYPHDSNQILPAFRRVSEEILSYHWPSANLDFNYPLEVSSSVYRTNDLLQLLQALPYNNPNTLEGQLAALAGNFIATRPQLLCFAHSITFCNPVNKTQSVYNNRAGAGVFSADFLAQKYQEGCRINYELFADFTPNACHQEVDLVMVSPDKVSTETEFPLVSVVIPCYNQAHFLVEAVESVVNQTYPNWECIVVNDGSPDNTSETARQLIAQHSGNNIRLLEKPNGGLSDARNSGIAQACGKYILPLDADDLLHPQMLEKAVAALESQPEFAFAYTDQVYFGAEEKHVRCLEYDFKTHLAKNYIAYCTLYLRSMWEAVGGYKTSMKWGYEDWEFWISCGENGFVGRRVPEPLFYYRVKENSMLTQALEHDAELKAQIILNHQALYAPESREWAKVTIASIK